MPNRFVLLVLGMSLILLLTKFHMSGKCICRVICPIYMMLLYLVCDKLKLYHFFVWDTNILTSFYSTIGVSCDSIDCIDELNLAFKYCIIGHVILFLFTRKETNVTQLSSLQLTALIILMPLLMKCFFRHNLSGGFGN